jgi:hypothetical protein
MGPERRGRADQGHAEANPQGEEPRESPGPGVKPFDIDKRLIFEAWEKVRANKGAPGVDAVGVGLFEERLKDNLYKLWNRMSSGSYFPGPVRGVEIPKDHGAGKRLLGVPNTADRVAQTAAAMLLEGGWNGYSTATATAIVRDAVPMTRWPPADAGAGIRTGCWTLMSGPFSIQCRIPCY